MELTFNDLKKRDVINIADGKCLGRITDLRLAFPDGTLTGIYVPGRRANVLFRLFDKTVIYIDVSKILKIGGDVILVNLRSFDECSERIGGGKGGGRDNRAQKKRPPDCHPPCPPPFPPTCSSPCEPPKNKPYCGENVDFSLLSGASERFDVDDY